MNITDPSTLIKNNPQLKAAIECVTDKIHPVISFYLSKKDNILTQFQLESRFPEQVRSEVRERLLKINDDYIFFESQVKQVLRGLEGFCETYGIEFK